VVAGGVGANRALRARLDAGAQRRGARVYYPDLEFCTDNGAMIAYAGAMRLQRGLVAASTPAAPSGFSVRPRWDLESVSAEAR
jgi:N6-L-threonylcarbamoyladenine synthase